MSWAKRRKGDRVLAGQEAIRAWLLGGALGPACKQATAQWCTSVAAMRCEPPGPAVRHYTSCCRTAVPAARPAGRAGGGVPRGAARHAARGGRTAGGNAGADWASRWGRWRCSPCRPEDDWFAQGAAQAPHSRAPSSSASVPGRPKALAPPSSLPCPTLSRTQRMTLPSSSATAAAACCSGATCTRLTVDG